jgi:hypothetical protein
MNGAIDFIDSLRPKLAKRAMLSLGEREKFDRWADGELRKYPPFDVFEGGWIRNFGGGGGGSGWTNIVNWLFPKIAAGAVSIDLISQAESIIRTNKAHYLQVIRIAGLTVDEKVPLDDDMYLCPNDALPEFWLNDMAFGLPHSRVARTADAALVIEKTVAPALVRVPESIEALITDEQERLEITRTEHRVSNVLGAITLAGYHRIAYYTRYAIPVGETLLTMVPALVYSAPPNVQLTPTKPDGAKVREILALLQKFIQHGALGHVIDRLRRSRLTTTGVDRAIDRGMALEAALMHEEKPVNQEINFKVGIRAAWLLGTDLETRRTARKKAGRIYSARSVAVHTGRLSGKPSESLPPEEADQFVRDCLIAILERGCFPNWTDLVLGG